MKHYDLTPIENFLEEKNLTANKVAKDLYVIGLTVSQLGLYCSQYIKSDALKLTAETIGEAVYSLEIFATAFIENNLEEFFSQSIHPDEMSIHLRKGIDAYKNIVAGLTLSNVHNSDVDCMMRGRENYVVLLRELADLCPSINEISEKA
ncbi:MAG: hypothetical protein AB7V25_00360 [Mangrovibacterium sp.]